MVLKSRQNKGICTTKQQLLNLNHCCCCTNTRDVSGKKFWGLQQMFSMGSFYRISVFDIEYFRRLWKTKESWWKNGLLTIPTLISSWSDDAGLQTFNTKRANRRMSMDTMEISWRILIVYLSWANADCRAYFLHQHSFYIFNFLLSIYNLKLFASFFHKTR